jgi:hypothetical protein
MIGADDNIVGCENTPSSHRAAKLRAQGADMNTLLKTVLSLIRTRCPPQKDSAI